MAIVKIDGIPVYDASLGEDGGMLRISLVNAPAVMADFVAFAKQKPVQMYRIEDEEQRRVLGVVMRADFPSTAAMSASASTTSSTAPTPSARWRRNTSQRGGRTT